MTPTFDDIAFDFLDKIYRPAWHKLNPGADPRICPSPDSAEWLAIARQQMEFWQGMSDSKCILHQHLSEDFGAEGVTICPECGKDVGQWYDEAWDLLEAGLCPFCDCNGIAEYEYRYRSRCQECHCLKECEQQEADAIAYDEERTRELIRYQCRGSGGWPPSGIGDYSRMFIGQ